VSFRDLSDRNAVLKAIAEFDKIGQDASLSKYGYGRARSYALIHEGRQYDSKAIVGAAFGHQFGTPLSPSDFKGGKGTVRPKFESLGFRVVAVRLDDKSSAFAEEVSPSHWEGSRRSITVNAYERNPDARAACIEHHGDLRF
jgi:5-methylcytosine-specific restriction protein A